METKILVVDDESIIIRVVTHTMKAVGIQAVGASHPEKALEIAQDERFDLAIVDINLPGMDGFELVTRLKALPNMQDVPIIMFTARSNQDDQFQAARAGAVDFLYKPFSTQELRDAVMRHLPPL